MGLVLAPISADKLATWEAFMKEMTGARKEEFEAFNRRHELTRHEAWLCETPAGTFVCAIHEGPGAAALLPTLARSSDGFDKWFVGKLGEIHGMDLSKPPPGKPAEKKLAWQA